MEVPGQGGSYIQLIPAGRVPSRDYWATLSRINWHDLFYSKNSPGVHVFLDLKQRIEDELNPDFLLIDSRTGITEMGGVATTLLADKVVCLVTPALENLEGTRAVLRSLRRSRREMGAGDLDFIVAVSRLPEVQDDSERIHVSRILDMMNETAEELEDTLSCSDIPVLHSESLLQVREALRVGGDLSTDQSILLRDYLRLFERLVPARLVEPKIGTLLEQAKARIWEDPGGATKEVEELAESFGRPEIYRELLRFYEVRNIAGERLLRRAQRLWDLTGDSSEAALWKAITTVYRDTPRGTFRTNKEWSPNLTFLESIWRDAGKLDPDFCVTLAQEYSSSGQPSRAADAALEGIGFASWGSSSQLAALVARAIVWLDVSGRRNESDDLIQTFSKRFEDDIEFVKAWAEHSFHSSSVASRIDLVSSPAAIARLKSIAPSTAVRLLVRTGRISEAIPLADAALEEVMEVPQNRQAIAEIGSAFSEMGRSAEFEKAVERMQTFVTDGARRLQLGPSSRRQRRS